MTINPTNAREAQIVRTLGADDWELVEARAHVACFAGGPGFLVRKAGHMRWVRAASAATGRAC
jgi:hypothetical protein